MSYSLSVIIPMYNRAHIISQAIESVLAQDLKDVEIIIVDDGSTDVSTYVVKSYAEKYSNILLIENEHKGPGFARNAAMEHASGEYITFLDSDDWIPKPAYRLMYQKAKEKDADVIIGQMMRKVNGGKWTPVANNKRLVSLFGDENCAKEYIIPLINPSACNKIFKRKMLVDNNIVFPDAVMSEDLAFCISVLDHAESIYNIDEIVYMYESNSNKQSSTISTISPKIVSDGIQVHLSIGLKFHEMGQINLQSLCIEDCFKFIFDRFELLPEGNEKNLLFEDIKSYFAMYKGIEEYRIDIESLIGMNLDTLLLLPYPTYVRQKTLLRSSTFTTRSAAAPITSLATAAPIANAPNAVIRMYEEGKIGLRFVFKCFKAWLKYKFKRKK